MNARQALVCPACGVLNRPTWEFCAKCGESLEGATLTTERDEDSRRGPRRPPRSPGSRRSWSSASPCSRWASSPSSRGATPGRRRLPRGRTRRCSPSPPFPRRCRSAPRAAVGARRATHIAEGRRLRPQAGDLEAARERFAAAVAADGANASTASPTAARCGTSGSGQQALGELGMAARLDPGRQLAYARALDIAGERTAAVNEYEVALARSPGLRRGPRAPGTAPLPVGAIRRGRPAPRAGGGAAPRRPGAEAGARLRRSTPPGTGDRAAEIYREVLEAAPEAVISRGLLADNLYEQGQKDEAMAVVQEGLELTPDAPLLQRQLGSLLERSGQTGGGGRRLPAGTPSWPRTPRTRRS